MNHSERERLFLELFHQHRARIQRLCYGYLNSAAECEDLFQEIMTNVWNSLPGFRGDSQAGTWLYRIAVNTALMHRRKLRPTEELCDLPDSACGPQQTLEQQERLAALHCAIATLPDQDRLVVTLLLEGLSYREIAEITGITVNYVGVKINRIKHAIEQKMTEVAHGAI
ncbi:MAG TPA: RNA polymerase sigma factor [Candidatus Acidoferrales bacterium]|nr:RNA polymerase sigma factor [Candidatus Acidoferrales bacterium]